MKHKPELKLVAKAQAYFHELVTHALSNQKVSAQPETEFYLVNLLNQFITTDKLYPRTGEGIIRDEPLVLMIKEALEQSNDNAQSMLFRHIGDFALYVAGFFQESLNRKMVDIDYYIGIGETAYTHVAARTQEAIQRDIYRELSDKFPVFVEVLAEVSEQTTQRSGADLIHLYDRWIRTQSERAHKALKDAGILPSPVIKKKWQ